MFYRFNSINKKIARYIWLSFLGVILLSCSIHEAFNAYDRSILRAKESEVDLTQYLPFQNDGKVAILNTPSTLKFETDLPLLDGATAMYPVYSAFAQAVYPEERDGKKIRYDLYNSEVACYNTPGAYKRLMKREVDIIFVARPSENQLEQANTLDVQFELTPIGKEAFVFFVNTKNPVDNLTQDQLKEIYSGTITNWKELGGKDENIRAFQRNENSGSQTAFLHFMQGHKVMQPPQRDVVGGMGAIIDRTADYTNYSNSIGFSFRFYANSMVGEDGIKLLKIDGVYPDIESVHSEAYPLTSYFYAVTLADNDKPNVRLLLDWIVSEQGQYLVEKTGYNPIGVKD